MTDYDSIDEFNHGWNFFTKKIAVHGFQTETYTDKLGKFPCSEFLCPGCDDWLDADNQNRNIDKL